MSHLVPILALALALIFVLLVMVGLVRLVILLVWPAWALMSRRAMHWPTWRMRGSMMMMVERNLPSPKE